MSSLKALQTSLAGVSSTATFLDCQNVKFADSADPRYRALWRSANRSLTPRRRAGGKDHRNHGVDTRTVSGKVATLLRTLGNECVTHQIPVARLSYPTRPLLIPGELPERYICAR